MTIFDSQADTTTPAPVSNPGWGRRKVAGFAASALLIGAAAGIGGTALYEAGESSASNAPIAATGNVTAPSSTTEAVAAKVLPSLVKINVSSPAGSGSGSGIVVSRDGEIVTNNHVVAGLGSDAKISVTLSNGRTLPATVVGTDPVTDLALIKAQGVTDLKPATLGHSSGLKVGQDVMALGAPYGLSATVTSGIVSALNRPVSVASTGEGQGQQNPFGQPQTPSTSTTYPAIQTDAAINPGNSGGPLVDMNGQVVGITSSIKTAGSSNGSSGGSVGLGFAIPIDEALPIINQLRAHQTPTHARLGISVGNAQAGSTQQGALVSAVDPQGVARTAGLQAGDLITAIDGQPIDGSDALVATVRGHRPNDKIALTYVRGGKTVTIPVALGSDAGTTQS